MTTRIALFGSAFNPPHKGHIDAIEQLLSPFDAVMVVPSACHAFGKQMVDFQQRLRMTELIVQECLPTASVVVSDIEQVLHHRDPDAAVYSYDVLCAVQAQQPNARFSLVLGPDNVAAKTWQRFHRYQEILTEFAVYAVEERLPLRSTAIRAGIAETTPAALPALLTPMIGQQAAHYVIQHGLYKNY